MDKDHLYYQNDVKTKDEMAALPEEVKAQLAAHLELYKRDPEQAHMWDTALIGIGGIVPCLMLSAIGAKSKQLRQNVLQYYRIKGNYVVVASRGGQWSTPFGTKTCWRTPAAKYR